MGTRKLLTKRFKARIHPQLDKAIALIQQQALEELLGTSDPYEYNVVNGDYAFEQDAWQLLQSFRATLNRHIIRIDKKRPPDLPRKWMINLKPHTAIYAILNYMKQQAISNDADEHSDFMRYYDIPLVKGSLVTEEWGRDEEAGYDRMLQLPEEHQYHRRYDPALFVLRDTGKILRYIRQDYGGKISEGTLQRYLKAMSQPPGTTNAVLWRITKRVSVGGGLYAFGYWTEGYGINFFIKNNTYYRKFLKTFKLPVSRSDY
jgi:hypothetical protein